jgi:hypothetical protein
LQEQLIRRAEALGAFGERAVAILEAGRRGGVASLPRDPLEFTGSGAEGDYSQLAYTPGTGNPFGFPFTAVNSIGDGAEVKVSRVTMCTVWQSFLYTAFPCL